MIYTAVVKRGDVYYHKYPIEAEDTVDAAQKFEAGEADRGGTIVMILNRSKGVSYEMPKLVPGFFVLDPNGQPVDIIFEGM